MTIIIFVLLTFITNDNHYAMRKEPKASEPTVTYLLRDVPEHIWRGARSRAILEGQSIRAVIVSFLDSYRYEDGQFVSKRTAQKKR